MNPLRAARYEVEARTDRTFLGQVGVEPRPAIELAERSSVRTGNTFWVWRVWRVQVNGTPYLRRRVIHVADPARRKALLKG